MKFLMNALVLFLALFYFNTSLAYVNDEISDVDSSTEIFSESDYELTSTDFSRTPISEYLFNCLYVTPLSNDKSKNFDLCLQAYSVLKKTTK